VLNCPKCGSPRVHRSRTRTFWEQFRKPLTRNRIHRCHSCGWRGWGKVASESPRPSREAADRIPLVRTAETIDVTVSAEQVRQGDPPGKID